MSNESEQKTEKSLTINDPVSKEVLRMLSELESARVSMALDLLSIEQERVRVLAAAHKLEEQSHRIYEKILTERGLPLNSHIEIEPQTGEITLQSK